MSWCVPVTGAISVLALAAASTFDLPKKLVFNATNSAPVGFYWLDKRRVRTGDYVFAHVPVRVRTLVESRRYLPRDVPLIKRVGGGYGDRICRIGQDVLINGVRAAVALRYDGQGRKMPQWYGCYVLTEGHIFLLQDHPRSFDSRYFGPVGPDIIIGRAVRMRFPYWKDDEG